MIAVALVAERARAASTDSNARAEVQRVLGQEFLHSNYRGAQKKLVRALQRCATACTGPTRAQILVALGLVAIQLHKDDEASDRFASALREDPDASLPRLAKGIPDESQASFDEAKRKKDNQASGTPSGAAPVAAPSAEPAEAPAPPEAPPPADADADVCAQRFADAKGAPGARLERATCEADAHRLLAAQRDAQAALREATDHQDSAAILAARQRTDELTSRVPHVTFVPPQGVADLAVTLDDYALPTESLSQRVPVDPGKHTVHAEGTIHGVPMVFDKTFHADEGETVGIMILLAPPQAEYLSPDQIKCMLAAKSQEELLACLPENQRGLNIKAGLETSGYTDTNHVNVVTPAVRGSVASPTAGWSVSGSYLVDVVSAASPDIVSEASPPFHEVRQAGTLGGGFKLGSYGVQLDAELSSEPDYLSTGGGIVLTADLNDKLITPSVGFNYSHDTIGRSTTPFSVFHHNLDVSEFEAGTTFVMSSTSVLLLSGTLGLERGDQSKPYRYVPMFSAATEPTLNPGASIGQVNAARLPVRPLEQLPLSRDRYAVGARFIHAFGSATLRLEQRLYTDSWAQTASTTDVRTLFDLSGSLRVWLHGRFNAQSATSFYTLAYTAGIDPGTGRLAIPAFRSDDRELGPLVTVTGGPGVLLNLGSAGKVHYGISAQTDFMFSKYFDALFITGRTAVYGTLGLDGEFE